MQSEMAVTPSDDLFSLGASFFEVLFDRSPFGDNLSKNNGLDWSDIDTSSLPTIAAFLTACTTPDETKGSSPYPMLLNFSKRGPKAETAHHLNHLLLRRKAKTKFRG